jgi:DNA mismatch repair protein MutS
MSDTMTTPAGKVIQDTPPGYLGHTPLLQQYFRTRAEHPGIILLMRVGDFYEAYGDDAKSIASDLNLTLTGRDDGPLRADSCPTPRTA